MSVIYPKADSEKLLERINKDVVEKLREPVEKRIRLKTRYTFEARADGILIDHLTTSIAEEIKDLLKTDSSLIRLISVESAGTTIDPNTFEAVSSYMAVFETT